MDRKRLLERARNQGEPWDMLIIGGGATGVGAAVDAASRGYKVLLLEQSDFGKGTSSRSTKLAHGGVRYLQQGNVSLVMEALKERGIMRDNAPHLVHDQRFIVPNYEWWEAPFYGIGMKVYDMLARKFSFGQSRNLSKEETLKAIPTLKTEGLRGGVQYYDGQFDDSRLLINMIQTAFEQGTVPLNYVKVTDLIKDTDGFVTGATARDEESGEELNIAASVVINATGAFCDKVRRMAEPDASDMIAPSQGVHVILDKSFLPGDTAIMVPHTTDGRVMFAIPWHDRALVGTTDTHVDAADLEPIPMEEEIGFILETAALYLHKEPTRADVLSAFAGIRPLVKAGEGENTAKLSRDHTIEVNKAGLLTIAGGKWTTYRHMAEDCINQAVTLGGLDERACVTRDLNIHGYHNHAEQFGDLELYGSDATKIKTLIASDPQFDQPLHKDLPYRAGLVAWAARHEMARTVDDFLARRTRALLLNAKASIEAAPLVAKLLAAELGYDQAWQDSQVQTYTQIAQGYLV